MLSKSAQYALRIMAHFALHQGDSPLRAQDIAQEVNIPIFYLSKILRRMVAAELLVGSKGHGGGFLIAKAPNKIKFCHVLEAVDGSTTERKCVFGWDVCSDKHPCVLHNRWRDVSSSFEKWARETTLADVQKDVKKLTILNQSAPLKEKIRQQK
jgi:Rrf2 family protein